ncbi:glycosyltransferase [Acidimicrobiaceae bacterium]|nr:glycosyltransferase [Acidimicrobiaceae bacterium]
MKVYLNNPKESWVVDRFRQEWLTYNKSISSNFLFNSDIIWLISPWTWKKIPISKLARKKVVCTIHHIDEEKFDHNQKADFYKRDEIVNEYHVISDSTHRQLSKYTKKTIHTIPFWLNRNIWFQIEDKKELRKKYNIPINSFVIGSFQRDTEGSDLQSPKLSKGPDQFIEIVSQLNKRNKNLLVLLTGKRRQYILKKLEEKKINFIYLEMVKFKNLNELYNCLDLYIVASRVEGGPQAIMECSLANVPLISTDVGIASQILDQESIFDMKNYRDAKPNIDVARRNAERYLIPHGFKNFEEMFRNIYEN